MVKQAVARSIDVDPIDRLEDKVKMLVDLIVQLRTDQATATEENARLSQALAALRGQLSEADGVSSELAALRNEREMVRGRVTDMLHQLDHLNL